MGSAAPRRRTSACNASSPPQTQKEANELEVEASKSSAYHNEEAFDEACEAATMSWTVPNIKKSRPDSPNMYTSAYFFAKQRETAKMAQEQQALKQQNEEL